MRLFLQWIEQYNELHFRVMRIVYKSPGSTRADIWAELHGEQVRENSAEADLFKLMIHDLSLGHVIRQHRDTTSDGRYVNPPRAPRRAVRSPVLNSAFEDDKPYELTGLGDQFVHYAMNEVVPRQGLCARSRRGKSARECSTRHGGSIRVGRRIRASWRSERRLRSICAEGGELYTGRPSASASNPFSHPST